MNIRNKECALVHFFRAQAEIIREGVKRQSQTAGKYEQRERFLVEIEETQTMIHERKNDGEERI